MPSTPIPCAVLYAPGINECAGSGAIDGVAQRIARTLDHLDEDVAAAYEVRVVPTEPYAGGKAFTEVREVVRCLPGKEPVLTHRLYNLDYQAVLAGEQPERNLLTQAAAVARVWAWMAWNFFSRARSMRSIGRNKKAAVFVGGCSLLLLSAYLAWLVLTMVGAALEQIGADPAVLLKLRVLIPSFLEPAVKALYHGMLKAWQSGGSVVSATTILAGLVGLSFESIRKRLEGLIQMFLSFIRYLDGGLGRAACTGKFNDLLEHILEQSPARVDIISYSMGSLIALDGLFPSKGAATRRVGNVSTLVTVGCPFDLVRTFWPDYFDSRAIPNGALKWINVFSPVDLLGSNFVNDEGLEVSPTRGINVACPAADLPRAGATEPALMPALNLGYDHAGRKTLDVANALLGGAYSAHSQYWIRGDARAESCFNLIVPQLYPGKA